MDYREKYVSFDGDNEHKGFYNEPNYRKALENTGFENFIDEPDDGEFPFTSAMDFLRGCCDIFALALQEKLGYTPYKIKDSRGSFHFFCQVIKNGRKYYVDVRGVTTSFEEFLNGAGYVSGESRICRMDTNNDKDAKLNEEYLEEWLVFAKGIIERYKKYYTV